MIARRTAVGTLLVIPGLSFSAAAASTAVASVVAVTGSCTAGKSLLKPGSVIQVGDPVEVPDSGRLKLQMTDGSIVSAAPGSSFIVASYHVGPAGRDVKLSLAQGLLRSVVPPASVPSVFQVTIPVGYSSASSADWFTAAQDGSAQVGVLSGTVDLTSATTGRSVTIPARWGTRLEAKRDPVQPRVWAHVEFDAFIRRIE